MVKLRQRTLHSPQMVRYNVPQRSMHLRAQIDSSSCLFSQAELLTAKGYVKNTAILFGDAVEFVKQFEDSFTQHQYRKSRPRMFS